MAKWVGNAGTKIDHPLADAKEAQQLLLEMRTFDSFKFVEDATYWAESLLRTQDIPFEKLYEIVDRIDQFTKFHQRKVAKEYLTTRRLAKFQENRVWTLNFEFWKNLATAYLLCFEEFQAKGGIASQALPTIAARALRAIATQMKWELLRYGPVEDKLWGDIARLYSFAESKGFSEDAIAVYPGAHGKSTVRDELVKVLMLSISSVESLVPLHLGIAERLIAHMSESFLFGKEKVQGCTHCYDLSLRQAPNRISIALEPGATMRYLGAGPSKSELDRLVSIAKLGFVPTDLNLGAPYPAKVVLEVLQHLELYWASRLPERRYERRRTITRLNVVHGFNAIIVGVFSDEHADQKDDIAENWVVENESEGGYGAIISQMKND